MAADIKNYLKEKEKRQKNQDDYKKKIRKHKLTIVYRVLLVAAALGAALTLVVVQASLHIYTGYDTVSSKQETSSDAIDVRLKNGILTYSKDGAHCTDAKEMEMESDLCYPGCETCTYGSVAPTSELLVGDLCTEMRNSWEPLPRPCQFVILR